MLPQCSDIIGHLEIRDTPLALYYRDALYVPRNSTTRTLWDSEWGLYHPDGGANIAEASYFQGPPGPPRIGQSDFTAVRPDSAEPAPPGPYLYGGVIIPHYGHFLISSTARLWPLLGRRTNAKIVFHSEVALEDLFSIPYIADVLGALDIAETDLAIFTRPTLLTNLLIPEPSFQETTYAHWRHAELCHTVGRRLRGSPAPGTPSSRAVYLSKCKLQSGVWNIVNETEMVVRLQQAGVDIVYPETLSLDEQIAVFERYPVIAGLAGSALHTTLFAQRPNRIVGLTHGPGILSNQLLIDKLKKNESIYVYPHGGMQGVTSNKHFHGQLRLTDPIATAESLLRHIDLMTQDEPAC